VGVRLLPDSQSIQFSLERGPIDHLGQA
jgi:hypothetical protein